MKISKQELIEMDASEDALEAFDRQANGVEETVEIVSLMGGGVDSTDLIWIAVKKGLTNQVIKFACDCALINIEMIRPYCPDEDFKKVVSYLTNPYESLDSVDDVISKVTKVALIFNDICLKTKAWLSREIATVDPAATAYMQRIADAVGLKASRAALAANVAVAVECAVNIRDPKTRTRDELLVIETMTTVYHSNAPKDQIDSLLKKVFKGTNQ